MVLVRLVFHRPLVLGWICVLIRRKQSVQPLVDELRWHFHHQNTDAELGVICVRILVVIRRWWLMEVFVGVVVVLVASPPALPVRPAPVLSVHHPGLRACSLNVTDDDDGLCHGSRIACRVQIQPSLAVRFVTGSSHLLFETPVELVRVRVNGWAVRIERRHLTALPPYPVPVIDFSIRSASPLWTPIPAPAGSAC